MVGGFQEGKEEGKSPLLFEDSTLLCIITSTLVPVSFETKVI
jgi:hypothetical protein